MNLEEKFKKGKASCTYQRIDPKYATDIFVGYNPDGQMSFVITEAGKVEKVVSSKLIKVQLKRHDSKYELSFDLLDEGYAQMFLVFCRDLIATCERAGKTQAISRSIKRWKYWKEMFGKQSSRLLSKQEGQGLIGELYTLKSYMIPRYGYQNALMAWRGPLLGHKDFEIDNTWYEIKTINNGVDKIHISSLEQLESDIDGHLIIVKVEETSEVNSRAINLNKLVSDIWEMLDDLETAEIFRSRLDNLGYRYEPDYDNYNYLICGRDMYAVTESFPILRRRDLNNAIGNVQYTILLPGITDYKE